MKAVLSDNCFHFRLPPSSFRLHPFTCNLAARALIHYTTSHLPSERGRIQNRGRRGDTSVAVPFKSWVLTEVCLREKENFYSARDAPPTRALHPRSRHRTAEQHATAAARRTPRRPRRVRAQLAQLATRAPARRGHRGRRVGRGRGPDRHTGQLR